MPSIRLKDKTKTKLDEIMCLSLEKKLDNASRFEKINIIKQVASKKYGVTYNDFLNELIDVYIVHNAKHLNKGKYKKTK